MFSLFLSLVPWMRPHLQKDEEGTAGGLRPVEEGLLRSGQLLLTGWDGGWGRVEGLKQVTSPLCA